MIFKSQKGVYNGLKTARFPNPPRKKVTAIPAPAAFRLSRSRLRAAALLAMTADHLAWSFLPTVSPVAALIHLAGRIAMPIFCFLLAEGFRCSRSLPRYALRLAGCALLSAVPYSLFKTGLPLAMPFSAAYTLLLCLAALAASRSRLPAAAAALLQMALLLLALPGDWGIYAVGWCLAFALMRDRPAAQRAVFCLLVLLHFAAALLPLLWQGAGGAELFCRAGIQLGSLLALPLLARCDIDRGTVRSSLPRRALSYLYYPLHLLVIDLLLFLR